LGNSFQAIDINRPYRELRGIYKKINNPRQAPAKKYNQK